MIRFRCEKGCEPIYKTALSSGADIVTKHKVVIYPGQTRILKTGVYIKQSALEEDDKNFEIQLRLRSSLGLTGLSIPNGIGTIDLDYSDEIGLIVYNRIQENIIIEQFSRVGQLVLTPLKRFDNIKISTQERVGGFGSTDI